MGTEQVTDLWALVMTSNGKYLGVIRTNNKVIHLNDLHTELMAGHVTLSPVFEFMVNLVPRQTPEGMALSREFGGMPVGMTLGGAPLHLYGVVAVQLFCEMKESDVDEYKRLVHDAEQLAKAASAQRAGIVLDGGRRA
jgi:hypothetical protein